MRTTPRILTLVLTLLGIQLAWLAAPAYACGCGAMIPGGHTQVRVDREVSVVRWDGRQEQIVMSLTVAGTADRAAWIMPVPHRATVRLGDRRLFEQLQEQTAPEHRTRYYFWPRSGDWPFASGDGASAAAPPAAGAGVGVVGRQRLGPFDVARLTADDPAALSDWLHRNGFALPARLAQALQPYVDRHWEYVAIRLAPRSDGRTALYGALDPLHLTFAADAPVYPMRLSRLAANPQSLGLYLLAAHRMEPRTTIGGDRPKVTFAGRVRDARGPLAGLSRGTDYLTALDQEFPVPSRIDGDHELRRAATDRAYREVVYDYRLREIAGLPAWLAATGGVLVVSAAVIAVCTVRATRRRTSRAPVPNL
ncbi:DUF2330 domain-containing protein [Streptomyces sp. NPDC028635]|uniref:DUF2330 domain-containing protein n=1 Tax=Streptomyces sp. NPDC028635 TaxID=3154800 RepID=UPI003401E6A8